jgi:hypothetical protein
LHSKGALKADESIDNAIINKPNEGGWTVDAQTGGFVFNREAESAISGWKKLGNSKAVTSVYQGQDLEQLYAALFGRKRSVLQAKIQSENTSFDEASVDQIDGYKMLPEVTWMRAKGKGEVTAEHVDYYYFKNNTSVFKNNVHPIVEWKNRQAKAPKICVLCKVNESKQKDDDELLMCTLCNRSFHLSCLHLKKSQIVGVSGLYGEEKDEGEWHCKECASQPMDVFTCWISLGDYTSSNSSLCVLPKSHRLLNNFFAPLKGNLLPGDYPGLQKNAALFHWQRAAVGLGDIILFNVKTVHGASKNTSDSFRLSMDTRVAASFFRPQVVFSANAKEGDPASSDDALQPSRNKKQKLN